MIIPIEYRLTDKKIPVAINGVDESLLIIPAIVAEKMILAIAIVVLVVAICFLWFSFTE